MDGSLFSLQSIKLSADTVSHGRRVAFRNILIVYAAICGLWIPINFWMMPWHALQIGQVSYWSGPSSTMPDQSFCVSTCSMQLMAP